ncbi:MAG: hypothetical protein INR63_00770 [Actinomycetospora chiangmaiensis]|nr:hypothetical protein [Actinomycetospora chiangmaiensis]
MPTRLSEEEPRLGERAPGCRTVTITHEPILVLCRVGQGALQDARGPWEGNAMAIFRAHGDAVFRARGDAVVASAIATSARAGVEGGVVALAAADLGA